MTELTAVGVFCGSSTPADPAYRRMARALGELLAERGIDLVYGGARVGLMGELAEAALDRGGRVVGVIPVGLFKREVGHTGLSELHEVPSMHERKRLMYDLAQGFIGLPGGLGTLEELAEAATWSQLGLHAKPVVLLDVDGFWEPLIALLDRMVAVGLLGAESRRIIQTASAPVDALGALAHTQIAYADKWLSGEER